MKIVSIILLEFDTVDRETLTKPLLSRLNDAVHINTFTAALYYAVVYKHAALQLLWLSDQLEQAEVKFTQDMFLEYLQKAEGSCVKMLAMEDSLQQIAGKEALLGVLAVIAEGALFKIFGC